MNVVSQQAFEEFLAEPPYRSIMDEVVGENSDRFLLIRPSRDAPGHGLCGCRYDAAGVAQTASAVPVDRVDMRVHLDKPGDALAGASVVEGRQAAKPRLAERAGKFAGHTVPGRHKDRNERRS